MALQWFEPDLLSDSDPNNCPLLMDDWKEFIIELQTTFGPHNPVADTEHELDHLQMKELQGYGDGTLHHHFYTGLPNHIKDKEVDACYWEHKEEIQCQPKSIASTGKQANCHAPFLSICLHHLCVTLDH
ncbi:hypothetical protein ID866_10653 [Astraeus odoratus]|nr:hypothetical protein ID866_10653 [Astraeus odoratus]